MSNQPTTVRTPTRTPNLNRFKADFNRADPRARRVPRWLDFEDEDQDSETDE